MKKYFEVNVSKYDTDKNFNVYCPSTLENPKDNAVSFLSMANYARWSAFEKCKENLIFWPKDAIVPDCLYANNHVIILCENPHLRYCEFFEENQIDNVPKQEKFSIVNGAYICESAKIGAHVLIQPGAYIGGEVIIGDNTYIGAGVKIMGEVEIGKNVIIRENTVIGADGLTTDRNKDGKPVKMPQFGNVIIADNVTIGANTVIARGAIDCTFIDEDTSIDNCTFVSHNVQIGKRVFIVGESILFGSSVVEDNAFISGNSTIRNGVKIGHHAIVGMGSVVVKNVEPGQVVKGNPAK